MIGRLAIAAGLCAAALIGAAIEWRRPHPGDAWKLVDAFGTTDYLYRVPTHSVILAPNLWDDRAGVADPDRYLTAYFSNMASRPLQVTRSDRLRSIAVGLGSPQGAAVYYLEHQWLPGRRGGVLLAARLHRDPSGESPFESDRLTVIALSELRNLAIQYHSVDRGPGQIAPGVRETPVTGWHRDSEAFLAEVPVSGWTPGSTRLVDEDTGNPVQIAVSLDFVRGFALTTEHIGGRYFRWSDGPEGEGEFDLVNSLDRPLRVRFRANLQFNEAHPTGAFDIATPAGTESIRIANNGLYERVWTLQPGSNRIVIQCHEGRRPSPEDTRYIVFGLWDWSVVPVAEGSPEAPR